MNLINPPFSFIQFNPGNDPSDCENALPLALEGDLKFQAIIQTSDAAQSEDVRSSEQKLYIVDPDAVITDETSLTDNTIQEQSNLFTLTQIADTKVLICWSFLLEGIGSLDEGQCFRFVIKVQDGASVEYYISNCFIKSVDVEFTSTLEYGGSKNNYGFDYCHACDSNKIRLPIYIGSPQMKEDQAVYIFSTGGRKLTKYSAAKLYDLQTEFLNENEHDKIVIALAHDVVIIGSARYSGGIRKDGEYVIEWDRIVDLTAPASAKVYSEVYVRNDNCAECDDYTPPILCAEISKIVGSPEMTPVPCAEIAEIVGTAEVEAEFSVTLGRTSTELIANVTGGTGPFIYHFYCVPVGGSCEEYSIADPDHTTSMTEYSTAYSTVRYAGVLYNFYVDVTDSTSTTVTAGPNAPAMCLHPDTLITMANGIKKLLRNIKPGDELLTIDLVTKTRITTFVTGKSNHIVKNLYHLNDGLLNTSEGHVNIIKNKDSFDLVQSVDLLSDDKLVNDELEEVEINTIEIEGGEFEVINISTTTKTYIANGILTHNKFDCP